MSQLPVKIFSHSINHHLNKKGPISTHMQLRFTAYVLSIQNQLLNVTKYNHTLYTHLLPVMEIVTLWMALMAPFTSTFASFLRMSMKNITEFTNEIGNQICLKEKQMDTILNIASLNEMFLVKNYETD